MDGEIDARRFQRLCGGAGVGVAGFDPVRNQDHGCLFLGIAQRLRRHDDSVGHRGLAHRADRGHGSGNLVTGVRAGRDDGFDIRTIAPGPVAIDGQSQILVRRKRLQQFGNDAPGNDNLVLAVDLPPHRPGCIHHDDRVGPLLGCGEQGQHQEKKGCEKLAHDKGSVRNSIACRKHSLGAAAIPSVIGLTVGKIVLFLLRSHYTLGDSGPVNYLLIWLTGACDG